MIDTVRYKLILDEGLLLDHYILLCNIRDGKELLLNKRVQGFVNLMHKKGYIEDGVVTSKGLRLLDGQLNPIVDPPEEPNPEVERFDYAGWVIQLHRKCEAKLVEKTGRRQVRDKIDGKPYPFLPNSTDLGKALLRAINHYKVNDFDKMEKAILAYVDKCAKANKWFPLLGYYIIKGGPAASTISSTMVTDMNSDDDEDGNDASIHIV